MHTQDLQLIQVSSLITYYIFHYKLLINYVYCLIISSTNSAQYQ